MEPGRPAARPREQRERNRSRDWGSLDPGRPRGGPGGSRSSPFVSLHARPRLLAHSPFPLLLFQDPGRHVDSLGTRERRERVCEWERFGIFGIFPVCEWERFGIFVIFPLTPLIKLPCFHSICASNPVPPDQKGGLLAGRATAAWMESSLQLAFLAFISAPAA